MHVRKKWVETTWKLERETRIRTRVVSAADKTTGKYVSFNKFWIDEGGQQDDLVATVVYFAHAIADAPAPFTITLILEIFLFVI